MTNINEQQFKIQNTLRDLYYTREEATALRESLSEVLESYETIMNYCTNNGLNVDEVKGIVDKAQKLL